LITQIILFTFFGNPLLFLYQLAWSTMLNRVIILYTFLFIAVCNMHASPTLLSIQGNLSAGQASELNFDVTQNIVALPTYDFTINLTGNKGYTWIGGGGGHDTSDGAGGGGYWTENPWTSIQVQVIIEDANGNVEFSDSYSVPTTGTNYSFSPGYAPQSTGTHRIKIIVPASCTGSVSFTADIDG
jgi:hypothetical protein